MLFRLLKPNSIGWRFVSTEIKGTGKQGEVTQMDILKWREGKTKHVREIEFGGQKQKWNYRSELVKRRGLDNDHKYIWMAFGGLIIIGFTAFVAVKTSVITNRRQAMTEREQMRKMLHLEGEDRKKIGVV
uniref:Transmembrane protein n=1 Tax=Panagrolaimus superbus TaxID=310955 RepID=A0A914Z5Z5_9BILA